MNYFVSDIICETANYFVIKVKTGFELYRIGVTCSVRVGQYGKTFKARAIHDCHKRQAGD